MQTLTAPQVIRRAANLVRERGLAGRGVTLAGMVCWAVHGSPCRPRDLTPLESEHVAEALDCLEHALDSVTPAYERRAAAMGPRDVAHDLRTAAWALERSLSV
jgi:hypothetical protein